MTSFDLLSTALPAAFFTLMLTLRVSGNMVDSPIWFSHFTYLSTGCSDVMVHSYLRKLDSVTLYGDDKSIIPPSVNPASEHLTPSEIFTVLIISLSALTSSPRTTLTDRLDASILEETCPSISNEVISAGIFGNCMSFLMLQETAPAARRTNAM